MKVALVVSGVNGLVSALVGVLTASPTAFAATAIGIPTVGGYFAMRYLKMILDHGAATGRYPVWFGKFGFEQMRPVAEPPSLGIVQLPLFELPAGHAS